MKSELELFIDEVQWLISNQNPSLPTGSNIYRFDLWRTNSINRSCPFFDWSTTGGSHGVSNEAPSSNNLSSGSFYSDLQDVSVFITTKTYFELKQMQYALSTALNRVSGSSRLQELLDYEIIPHNETQNGFFQLEQRMTVASPEPINNSSINVTITAISSSIYTQQSGSLTGSLDDAQHWLNIVQP